MEAPLENQWLLRPKSGLVECEQWSCQNQKCLLVHTLVVVNDTKFNNSSLQITSSWIAGEEHHICSQVQGRPHFYRKVRKSGQICMFPNFVVMTTSWGFAEEASHTWLHANLFSSHLFSLLGWFVWKVIYMVLSRVLSYCSCFGSFGICQCYSQWARQGNCWQSSQGLRGPKIGAG